jgi:tetratricopeptide (TPR) repeat protein
MDCLVTHYNVCFAEVCGLDRLGDSAGAAKRARAISDQAFAAGDHAYANFFLGKSFCLMGDYRTGVALEEKAANLLLEVPFVQAGFGVLLSIVGEAEKALRHLDLALELAGDDLQVLAQKSVCLAKLERYRAAMLITEKILAIKSGHRLVDGASVTGAEHQPATALLQAAV